MDYFNENDNVLQAWKMLTEGNSRLSVDEIAKRFKNPLTYEEFAENIFNTMYTREDGSIPLGMVAPKIYRYVFGDVKHPLPNPTSEDYKVADEGLLALLVRFLKFLITVEEEMAKEYPDEEIDFFNISVDGLNVKSMKDVETVRTDVGVDHGVIPNLTINDYHDQWLPKYRHLLHKVK